MCIRDRIKKGVPCKPGLKELLSYLEDLGMPRIVASSSPRTMIELNLQTTGTARYFHDIVCGNEVKLCKPAPDIFLEAARRIKVDIHDCMVLEDSHNGIRAGHADVYKRQVLHRSLRQAGQAAVRPHRA